MKCESNKIHPTNLCANPEKYDRSSKAMEVTGSVDEVLDIWENCPTAYHATISTDEDATTCSKLSHCMAELVTANIMMEAECQYPPTKEGRTRFQKE